MRKVEHQLAPAVGGEQAAPPPPRMVIERDDVRSRVRVKTASAAHRNGSQHRQL
jgi:hypothetical protein